VAVAGRYLYLRWLENHGLSLHDFVLTNEQVYSDALADWRSRADPYRTIHGALRFVYPPIFLYVGGFLARLVPDHIGWYLYILVHVASTIALPIVLARFYFCQTWLNAGFALLIFFAEPRFTGIMALGNGNIASLLYLIAFLAMIPGLRANRWTLFYLAVFIGALVKLPLLLLLLLPLLTADGQWRSCALCTGAIAAAYGLQRAFLPDLYAGYQWSLVQQMTVIHHYGYGVLGIAAGVEYKLYGTVSSLPTVLTGIFSAALIVALFLLRRRIDQPASNHLWLSLLVVSVVLVSPRILNYDSDIALLAAFVISVNVLHTRRLLTLLVVLYVPSLFVPFLIKAQTLVGSYETLLLLLAFAGGFLTLWRQPALARQSAPQPA
jgi:hypothetical protein